MKSTHTAKIILIDVGPDTAQQIRANLPAEYSIRQAGSSAAAAIVEAERPDLLILGMAAKTGRFSAGPGAQEAIPVIILTGEDAAPGSASAGREIYCCPGAPLDIPQLKECVREALSVDPGSDPDTALPADVEMFIRYTVEELVEENVSLGSAVQKFTARFSDIFSRRDRK
jgi:hypothetical protein